MEQEKELQGKEYELSFLTKEETGKEKATEWVRRFGGEVTLEGTSENIVLAYPIEKQTSAYFGYLHFRMNPDQANALSRELTTSGSMLRFLLITPPSAKAKPRTSAPRMKPEQAQAGTVATTERKPASETLSNEDLEKKIEEILQQK